MLSIISTAYPAPQVAADGEANADFGKYPAKNQQEAFFKIKNTGDEDLKILRLLKTCGACAEIKVSKDEIKAGEVADVTLKVAAYSLSGAYAKNFFIETNDPAQKFFRFTFRGNAVPAAEIKPSTIVYAGRLETGKPYKQSFQIIPTLSGIELGEPEIESYYPVKASLNNKGDAFCLDFEFLPEKSEGEMRIKIKIPISKPEGWKPLEITIVANFSLKFIAVPGKIVLPVKSDTPIENEFQLKLVGGEGKQLSEKMLSIDKPEGAEFKISNIENNIFAVRVIFSPSFIDKLAEKKNIPLKFSIPDTEPAMLDLSTE
ncbi:MAG: hypothetical protein A2X45_16870 [Lentisphaerae bacterium GWF2_50_93]|nr:MAG: hypothetical protein A2X45_16870 [Lentisphaerae bacterium GWF2_50_93]